MKPARGALLALPLVTLLALALSGCASEPPTPPSSVAAANYSGLPATIAEGEAVDDSGPLVLWLEEGTSVSVTTWGSSGCPAILTEVNEVDDSTLELQFQDRLAYGDAMCTADYSPHTSEVELPAGLSGRPLTVTVSFDGEAPLRSVVLG